MYKYCLLTFLLILPLFALQARGAHGGDFRGGGEFRGDYRGGTEFRGDYRGAYDREAYRRGYDQGAFYGGEAAAPSYSWGGSSYVPYTEGPEDWSAPDEENIFQQDQE